MIKFGQPLLIETIKSVMKNNHKFITQSNDQASYASKIEKETKNYLGINLLKLLIEKLEHLIQLQALGQKLKHLKKG